MAFRRFLALRSPLWLWLAASAAWFGAGCAASGDATPSTATGTRSGTATGGQGGTTTTGTGQGGAGASGGGTAGTGGVGGTGAGWPNCDSNPGGLVRTIPQIWQDDPSTETAVWVEDVVVTAVGYAGCSAGYPCTIIVQQDETYASWAAGAQHAIKLFASPATAGHFSGISSGDRVDIYAHAVRYTLDGRNELTLLVNAQYPGCAKDVGDATPQPIVGVTLDDLTVTSYEITHGPLFVRIEDVSGTPAQPDEIFGLWPTGQCCGGGIEEVTSLSPYCLPSGQFQGLSQTQTDFDFVAGVFGQYVPTPPPDPPPKYEVLYPRQHSEY